MTLGYDAHTDREVRVLRRIARAVGVLRWFSFCGETIQALSDLIMTISDVKESRVREMMVYIYPINMCHWAEEEHSGGEKS